jgi:hypothetical protein
MQINEDQFDEFKPITNPHADHGYNRCLFETYGAELNFVRSQPKDRVWTVLDNGTVVSGMRTIDRVGYIVTEIPWSEETEVA